jgi:hypothetical protein
MNTAKVTRVNETDETFSSADGAKFTVVELELNGSESYVWAKWEKSPLPQVNDFIEYANNGKDKQGRDKIKGVKIQSVKLMEATGTTSAEDAKQVFISRSVSLEHAVKLFDITKNAGGKKGACYEGDYHSRVLHIANEFFNFIYRGEVPAFVPVEETPKEVVKNASRKKPATEA